jgi:cysteine desulfurase
MRYYLDHNATTPVDPRVLARFLEVEAACPGNPSSAHAAGRRAAAAVEQARSTIAQLLAVDEDEVLFVSGGTEANNMAVLGLGAPQERVAASVGEHPSALQPAKRRGWLELGVDRDGRTVLAAQDMVVERVAALCLVHGQSEVGVVQDVAAARAWADRHGALLHVDASQTLGRVELQTAVAVADTLTLSMHKAGGLKGVGVLVARRRAGLRALLHGGGQERGLRSGTVSPALAAAAARTVELAFAEREARAAAMRSAREAFYAVVAESPSIVRWTPDAASLPNTLLLEFSAIVDGRALLPAFDLAGVEASHGSACASGSPQPPPVLLAMGCSEAQARRCVRFSVSAHTSIDAAQQAGALVRRALEALAKR